MWCKNQPNKTTSQKMAERDKLMKKGRITEVEKNRLRRLRVKDVD
jgi:hypothetical protein